MMLIDASFFVGRQYYAIILVVLNWMKTVLQGINLSVGFTSITPNKGICSNAMKRMDAAFFLRKRYYVVISLMTGIMILILMGIDLNICLADITSNKTYYVNNVTIVKEAEFHWSSMENGVLLSAMSWGYISAPVSSLLVNRFNGVYSFGCGICIAGILTIIAPQLMKMHYLAFLAGRWLTGIGESITLSSMGDIFIKWIPPQERTILSNIAFAGVPVGIIIGYPVAGYLAYHFNWVTTFYITGSIALLWSLLWFLLVESSPTTDKFITKVEKNYLQQLNPIESKEKIPIPWKKILRSSAFWALLNERFTESWSTSFLTTCLPLYVKDTYNENLMNLGWFSSVPAYFEILGKIPTALLADYLRQNEIYSKTTIHKIYILLAQIGAVIFLIVAGIANNFLVSIIAFCGFRLCFTLAYTSYSILPVDIGGCHSNFIYSSCIATLGIGLVLNPVFIGFMVRDHTASEWNRYFLFLCLFNVWAAAIFAFYGSGELQPWATTPNMDEGKNENVDRKLEADEQTTKVVVMN